MFIKIQPTTLLQIFFQFTLASKVILKSNNDPDDPYQGDLLDEWVNPYAAGG